ncbi:MAG: hypothetical protein LBH01_09345 [Verrucomicrobiales bacterium]|jgi:hypothetical protein|nr:hypothetical protein [Verrucomicrobiales bacterium]
MKASRAMTGRFQIRLSFSTSEIDDICTEALRESHYMPAKPAPIRIDRFVEKHFECNTGYDDLQQGVMGYTLFSGKGKVLEVMLSNKIDDGKKSSDRRVRSTWAHEAGHCLLHANLFIEEAGQLSFSQTEGKNTNIEGRKILCRDNDIKPVSRTYDGRWWEWQANRCIGGLLLPKSLVGDALADILDTSVMTGVPILSPKNRIKAEEILVETFDVNPVVARIRLGEMFPENKGQLEF